MKHLKTEKGKRFADDENNSNSSTINEPDNGAEPVTGDTAVYTPGRYAEPDEPETDSDGVKVYRPGRFSKTDDKADSSSGSSKGAYTGRRYAKSDDGDDAASGSGEVYHPARYAKSDDEPEIEAIEAEEVTDSAPDNSLASRFLKQTHTAMHRRKSPAEEEVIISDTDDDEERRPSKKRWTVVVPIVIVVLVLIGIFAVLAVQFMSTVNLDTVQNTTFSDVTENSVTLHWDKVGSANGYHIYQKKENYDNFMQIATTDENTTYTVTDLDQATHYTFFVKAFNGSNESEKYIPLENVCTLPEKEEIVSLTSDKAGALLVEWKQNSSADGYVIEFHTAGADYRPEDKIYIDSSDTTLSHINNLEQNKEVGVRVSAYCNDASGSKIVGAPSDEKTRKVWDGKTEQPGQKSDKKTENKNGQTNTTAPTQAAESYTEDYNSYSDQYSEQYDDSSSYDYYYSQSGGEYGDGSGDYSGDAAQGYGDSGYGGDGGYGGYGDGSYGDSGGSYYQQDYAAGGYYTR